MHILIAHNAYGRPSGEERALDNIEALLTSRGHRVSRFERQSSEIGDSFWNQTRAALSGIENPFSRRRLMAVLAADTPDLVLVQNLYPFLSPSILRACHAHDVPVVMRCSNYRLFCPSGTLQRDGAVCERCLAPGREFWCVRHNCEGSLPKSVGYALRNASARLGRRIVRYVDQYIVLTEFQKRYFMDRGIPEALLAVVPNHAEPAPDPLPAAGPLVSMIGRVSPEKGVGDFLELARRLPDIPFALAGEIRPTMRAPLADAPTNVRVLGHLDAVPRAALMADTRIVVLCNRWYEGFPNAALEAMALGKPVVAPALGALPEIVDDGVTGLLYPPGELAAAAEALRFLHADPARAAAMGAAARRKVAAQFQAEHAYLAYLNAFQRARAHASAEEALEIDAASAPA